MEEFLKDRMRKDKKQEKNIEALKKCFSFGTKICKYTWTYEIAAVDDSYAGMLGLSAAQKEDLIGTKMSDIIHPGDLERVVKETLLSLQGTGKYVCKYRMKTAEEEYKWVWEMGERFYDEDQEYIQGTVVDIDEKERLIRQRDVTYESVPGGVVFVVIDKNNFYIREANQHYFDMFDIQREEYLGSSGKYTFPEDLPKLREHFIKQAAKREPIDFEFRTRIKEQGEVVWCHILGNYIDSREEGEEYLCILMDISGQKAIQHELIQEKERYERTLNNTADLLFEYNIRHKQFRILGRNHISDDTKLAIPDELEEDYLDILFKKDIVFRGDRNKIKQFIRGKNTLDDTIRLLTKNTETGTTYYDNFELFLNKICVKGKPARVIGYVKKVSYNAVPTTMRQELHQIFDEQILNDYSFILKIDVPTGAFVPYFIEQSEYESYGGNRYYDSFLKWWCNTIVNEKDRKEIGYFLRLDEMLRILHSGEPSGYHFCRVNTKDTKKIHKLCAFSFYGTDINTILLAVRDVSKIRAEELYQREVSQRLLTDALVDARAAAKSRQFFMTYIADELSTPIEKMKDILLNPDIPDMHMQLERCVEYMNEMIGATKEYWRLQTPFGKATETCCLYALCSEVCEEERKISLGMDISIHEVIEIPEKQEYYIYGERFKEILINLLGNAVKYAPKGSNINMYFQTQKKKSDRNVIQIRMEDEGPAINRQFFERMVEKDYDYNIEEKMIALGGSGYSISLVVKLTELMGGTIEFRQGVYQSNVVVVEIPVGYGKENRQFQGVVHREDVMEEVNMHGQGFLLVEKSEQKESLTASLLKVNGARVYQASSGKVAMELLDKFNYGQITAILLEKELEDMKGFELAKQIRFDKDNEYNKLPIILMNEGIEQEDSRIRFMSGINATIPKPINLSKLLWIVENLQGKGV
ncbi:MAG: PAS domain-containing protein [Eubacterium sp.]|nr:PAS domain-containing protein [Eubacterium sp.]